MYSRLTPTRDHVVRLQELVKSYRRLIAQDLVNFSDEAASARRRFQFNTGPSGIGETLRNLSKSEELCRPDSKEPDPEPKTGNGGF